MRRPLKTLLKRSVVAARDLLGPYAPAPVARRLPPPRGQVARVADWAAAGAAGDGAAVLYWEPVGPRARAVPPGLPPGWGAFAAEAAGDRDPLFVVSLRGARVHGLFPAVQAASGRLVEEVSRVHSEPIDTHPTHARAVLPRPRRLAGRALLLASAYGENFYHWFVDVLPRLELARRAGVDLAGVRHVLVPRAAGPYGEESLRAFPELAGKLVPLSNETHWVCDELVCPSPPHRVGDADAWGPAFVRGRVLGGNRQPSGARRLYVSRAAAGRRRLLNEAELFAAVLAPRGFERVELERLPLRAQAELFADAAAVVTPHGAGLTNLIYAPERCAVVELLSEDYPATCYWHLADELGLDYRCVVGPAGGPADGQYRDFTADPARVGEQLDASGAAAPLTPLPPPPA